VWFLVGHDPSVRAEFHARLLAELPDQDVVTVELTTATERPWDRIAVRAAAPDLWAHRSGLILALSAWDFERAAPRASGPSFAERIDALLASAAVDPGALAAELHNGTDADAPKAWIGAVTRLTGVGGFSPVVIATAMGSCAYSYGGRKAARRVANMLEGSHILATAPDLSGWREAQQRSGHAKQSSLLNIAGQARRATLLESLKAELTSVSASSWTPYIAGLDASCASIRRHTLRAIELALGASGDHVREGRGAWQAVAEAARLLISLGQAVDAQEVLRSRPGAPQALASVVGTGDAALDAKARSWSLSLLTERRSARYASRLVGWSGEHPRTRAHALLLAARVLLDLGDLDPALALLKQLKALPPRMRLLPPWERIERLRRDATDPYERGLAGLRDALIQRAGVSAARELPTLPGLDIEIDPVAELRAEALRIEARIHGKRGETEMALAKSHEADAWYVANRWDPATRAAVYQERAEILLASPGWASRAEEALNTAEIHLQELRAPDVDLRPVPLLVDIALSRARCLAGARGGALHTLDAALSECEAAGNVEQESRILLAIARLSSASAPWQRRADAAQRVLALARESWMLIEEGRGLAAWARLLVEVGRDSEAHAARADAEWIAARCPSRALLEDLAWSNPTLV
jgi:tetratricopeptide (TPR) repeat protein